MHLPYGQVVWVAQADDEAGQAALFRQSKAFDIDAHNVAKWAEHLCKASRARTHIVVADD